MKNWIAIVCLIVSFRTIGSESIQGARLMHCFDYTYFYNYFTLVEEDQKLKFTITGFQNDLFKDFSLSNEFYFRNEITGFVDKDSCFDDKKNPGMFHCYPKKPEDNVFYHKKDGGTDTYQLFSIQGSILKGLSSLGTPTKEYFIKLMVKVKDKNQYKHFNHNFGHGCDFQ